MNYFVMVNGIVNLLAASSSCYQGHYKWAAIWLCYGLASLTLCTLERAS